MQLGGDRRPAHLCENIEKLLPAIPTVFTSRAPSITKWPDAEHTISAPGPFAWLQFQPTVESLPMQHSLARGCTSVLPSPGSYLPASIRSPPGRYRPWGFSPTNRLCWAPRVPRAPPKAPVRWSSLSFCCTGYTAGPDIMAGAQPLSQHSGRATAGRCGQWCSPCYRCRGGAAGRWAQRYSPPGAVSQ